MSDYDTALARIVASKPPRVRDRSNRPLPADLTSLAWFRADLRRARESRTWGVVQMPWEPWERLAGEKDVLT